MCLSQSTDDLSDFFAQRNTIELFLLSLPNTAIHKTFSEVMNIGGEICLSYSSKYHSLSSHERLTT